MFLGQKTLLSVALLGIMSAGFTTANAQTAAAPDADMQAVLNEMQVLGAKPIETLSVQEARINPTVGDAAVTLLAKKGRVPGETGLILRNMMISGAAGNIGARLYTPIQSVKGVTAKLPLIVYYHGGGWVIGDIDSYDTSARALSKLNNAIVLSVDYRRGPENKFPAAHQDAFAAYRWALKNAAAIGVDSQRIAVAGESAGANLALNVAIRARDSKVQMPLHEVLIYPVAGDDMNTASYEANATAEPLSKAAMVFFFNNYLNTMNDAKDPRINLVAANLRGLPPTTIITAQIDPLQSEGLELAVQLKNQGVTVNSQNYNGVTHEFFGLADVVAQARAAQSFVTQELKAPFTPPQPY